MERKEHIYCQDCLKDLGEKFYSDQLEYCDECYPLPQQILDFQERENEVMK